jgi:ketosteroid isomerase-like protein
MKKFLLLFALVVAACATQSATEPSPVAGPAAVIAAERAFAHRATEIGWIPAFREYVAPDGQLAGPGGFANAPQQLAAAEDDGNRNLYWWPAYAGVARSGDFGFTTGPASFDEARTPRIIYFTVWRRQADGSWKWIYDGGAGPVADPAAAAVDAQDIPTLPVATRGVGAAAAIDQVTALERDASTASLAPLLAADARVNRPGRARGEGAGAPAIFAFPEGGARFTMTRIETSSSGDLVFTLGEAAWTREGAEVRGLYGRIWQHRENGWRIVYDQLIALRPPQPPAAN